MTKSIFDDVLDAPCSQVIAARDPVEVALYGAAIATALSAFEGSYAHAGLPALRDKLTPGQLDDLALKCSECAVEHPDLPLREVTRRAYTAYRATIHSPPKCH